jgi:hypothetical protein
MLCLDQWVWLGLCPNYLIEKATTLQLVEKVPRLLKPSNSQLLNHPHNSHNPYTFRLQCGFHPNSWRNEQAVCVCAMPPFLCLRATANRVATGKNTAELLSVHSSSAAQQLTITKPNITPQNNNERQSLTRVTCILI